MHALAPLALCLALFGCATEPQAITFSNFTDRPIERVTLSYRDGPVSPASFFTPRVEVTVRDLLPGETKAAVPTSPPQGSVRLHLDWNLPGDDGAVIRQLSARIWDLDDSGFFPEVVFWSNGEITLHREALPTKPLKPLSESRLQSTEQSSLPLY